MRRGVGGTPPLLHSLLMANGMFSRMWLSQLRIHQNESLFLKTFLGKNAPGPPWTPLPSPLLNLLLPLCMMT